MARARIAPGTVGPVSVVPLATTDDGAEVVVPAPVTDGGEPMPYPKGWKVGLAVKTYTDDGVHEFVITRWRGLARAVDVDGTEHMIRRWRDTRAAAETATRQAGLDKLADLAARRERAALDDATTALGDTTTTVGDLLRRTLDLPSVTKLAPRTREAYAYTVEHVTADAPDLMGTLPRDVDVAMIREFLAEFTVKRGSSAATKAKALLKRAFDLAVESKAMQTPVNVVTATRDAIPATTVVDRGHQKQRVPTDAEVDAFLTALRADPMAGPMLGPRHKSQHGQAGKGRGNPVDVADLLTLTFRSGMRIGEASALRWGDLHLVDGEGGAEVSGTVSWIKGQGTVRQGRTKTKSSERLVPLRDDVVAMLRDRAELFGVNLDDDEQLLLPVFGSPQKHGSWREPSNLMTAVRKMLDAHGLGWASSHTARRWRVTSLLDRGVPMGKVADVVGHGTIRTTIRYVGRGRKADDQVRDAL